MNQNEQVSVQVPTDEQVIAPKKRGRGRPRKTELQEVRESRKGKVGRPRGDNSRMQELKDRLLATGGTRILDKVVSIALDDDHQGQMAALKMCMDRLLPASVFDQAKNSGAMPQISINISQMGQPTVDIVEDITDVDIEGD